MRTCFICGCSLIGRDRRAEMCGACAVELLGRVGLGIRRDKDGFAQPVQNLTRPREIGAESEVQPAAQPAGFLFGGVCRR